MLWSTAPWRAGAPDGVRWGGANFELGRRGGRLPALLRVRARTRCPHIPLWNPHIMAGRPFLGERPVRGLLAVQLARLRAAVLEVARRDGGAQAVRRRVRHLPVRPRARHALRRARCWPGVVFAFGTFFVVWLAWPLTNIFPLHAVAAAADASCWCAGPGRCRRPGSRRSVGARVLRRAPGDDLPRAVRHRASSSRSGCCSRGARRRAPRRALTRPAVAFGLALLGGRRDRRGDAAAAARAASLHSGDYDAPARPCRRATAARSTWARCSCSTTGAGRPRRRWCRTSSATAACTPAASR